MSQYVDSITLLDIYLSLSLLIYSLDFYLHNKNFIMGSVKISQVQRAALPN
jgi:hypothetical protein